ncbi:ABC transporter with duplicated ATPase domains [Nannizzia gypsea CBS 118893]|uniref:ABC transporter with duplicated ATPase domains n=1 Tax=Arthroderma gypseum (strain ATCC MYA-4604 / CBS 118893) TaxID=535722 RepID=E4UNS4_ARTGP|nr:ABC transporter with duplicated ATPase domains [Nannizzia gypsea CBS 118893]EFQ99677.1 ABC transporter with duplicated ATPase domains [Nannizzia gypsea CBS 118893]
MPLIYIAFAITALALGWISIYRKRDSSRRSTSLTWSKRGKEDIGSRDTKEKNLSSQLATAEWEERFRLYKELYFKLQHLENYPDIIPTSKSVLLSFLSGAIHSALVQNDTILSIENFSSHALDDIAKRELDDVTLGWQRYLERRKAGNPRELFRGREEAKRWLVRMAPTKFVDGAWLGHVHKIKTPFAYRSVTKDAWQVLSEELGDGDLDKNHVQVYKELLRKVGVHLPAGNSIEFTQHPGMDNIQVWQSAVIQLLISLFPQEFLPEILGFSMHFEMLTFETIVAAKELRELNIDPYYFTLHITIDNADTGHARMAKEAVTKYLELIKVLEGSKEAHKTWKRVQAGYLLSKCLPLDLDVLGGAPASFCLSTQYETEVLRIFESKAAVSNRIHDNCRASFGGRKLGAWLEPESFKQKNWQLDFLYWLSNTKPWVYKGDSARSRFVQLISWGGPMFGAFTHGEVDTIRAWINSLTSKNSNIYRQYTERTEGSLDEYRKPDFNVGYPVFLPDAQGDTRPDHQPKGISATNFPGALQLDIRSSPNLPKLLPLWFSHPCILESFISVPWQTASKTGCAAVRFLRAQYGYGPETPDVAGVDEMRRRHSIDLIDIGMEMLESTGCPSPKCLTDVLDQWPSPFAETLLALSVRPQKYRWFLLGLAQAFVQLHAALASSSVPLSPRSRNALRHIIDRENKNIAILVTNDGVNEVDLSDLHRGYILAREEIQLAFSGS